MAKLPKSRFEDFDPEDLHFGEHDGTSAAKLKKKSSKKKAAGEGETDGREHYGGLAPVRKGKEVREDELGAGKYSGEKSSRAKLEMVAEESEEELSDIVEPDISFDEEEVDQGSSKNLLLDELKQMQEEEEAQLQLVSSRAVNDVERGKNVKNQYAIWDMILDMRVQMQPLLSSVNRLPSACEVLAFGSDEKIEKLRCDSLRSLDSTIARLLDVQQTLMAQDKIRSKRRRVDDSDIETLWKKACSLERGLIPFCQEALDKWHQKVVLSGEGSGKKQLRVINQGIWQQVELAMRDQARLLSRTQILRQPGKRIACPEDDSFEDADGNKNVFPDIFDDTDFYQMLLREWVESNPARQGDPSVAGGIMVKAVQRGNASVGSDNVDRRASKGRKLRYDVHDKLVNYMVPMHCGPVPWNDEKILELFTSLLAH